MDNLTFKIKSADGTPINRLQVIIKDQDGNILEQFNNVPIIRRKVKLKFKQQEK